MFIVYNAFINPLPVSLPKSVSCIEDGKTINR